MKAITCNQYGTPDILKMSDVPKPIPMSNEVMIKVHAASITAADTFIRSGTPYFGRLFMGLTKPKYAVTGTGYAGVIVGLGDDVDNFKLGDYVFGECIFRSGSHTEYICVDKNSLVMKIPEQINFAQAASLCDGALTSFNFLTKVTQLRQGQKILINGAAGSLGSSAIQIAKSLGAEVTAVCSGSNVLFVTELGADQVIDYQAISVNDIEDRFDVIYDSVGKLSFCDSKHLLKPKGEFITPVLKLPQLFIMLATKLFNQRVFKFSATGMMSIDELQILLSKTVNLIQKNELVPVIDKSYSLFQMVEAHHYIETGHKRGNVVLDLTL